MRKLRFFAMCMMSSMLLSMGGAVNVKAAEETGYPSQRTEIVQKKLEKKMQEAEETHKYVKEHIIEPLQERYEKEIREYWLKYWLNNEETERLEVYWSYDYQRDFTEKENETYMIYLTAVNIQYEEDGSVVALPWHMIQVSAYYDEATGEIIIEKSEESWFYDIVLEVREDGSTVIRIAD